MVHLLGRKAGRITTDAFIGTLVTADPPRPGDVISWLTVFDDARAILDRPVLVLDPDIDLVLAGGQLAIIRPPAFERLCPDLQISQARVPHHMRVVTNALPTAPDTAAAIDSVCQHRTRAGRLLREISSFSAEQWHARTAGRVAEVLSRRGFRREDISDDSGELSMTAEPVPTLLELLASRYFTSDVDAEEMRADNARRRT